MVTQVKINLMILLLILWLFKRNKKQYTLIYKKPYDCDLEDLEETGYILAPYQKIVTNHPLIFPIKPKKKSIEEKK